MEGEGQGGRNHGCLEVGQPLSRRPNSSSVPGSKRAQSNPAQEERMGGGETLTGLRGVRPSPPLPSPPGGFKTLGSPSDVWVSLRPNALEREEVLV